MLDWVKQNKFITLLIVAVFYIFLQLSQAFFGINTLSLDIPQSGGNFAGSSGAGSFGSLSVNPSLPSYTKTSNEYAPQTDSTSRLVVQESNTSLLVKNVVEVRNKILDHTTSQGGYMVNTNTSNPQDAPTAAVTIRIPSDKLQSSLDYFHSLSVKVVSENLRGTDVTDQYTDIEKRIAQLERTKEKIEGLLDQATQLNEISNLTQQVLNYQNQIDALKGQQMSLEQNAKLAKLTIYLSTDEIALPYAPSETFRPTVIFKLAVRSLVGNLRNLATLFIWLAVYSVIWIPLLFLFRFFRRWQSSKKSATKQELYQK